MKTLFAAAITFALAWCAGVSPAVAQEDASASDTAVEEALAVHERMLAASLARDAEALAEILSPDFVASDPSNTIRDRDGLMGLFVESQVVYSDIDASVDLARALSDDLVVVMGTESTQQTSVPPGSQVVADGTAHTLHRRYTNVFRKENGAWRLLIKQSTVFAVD